MLYKINSVLDFKEKSEGTIWNITNEEVNSETIYVVSNKDKKIGIRVDRGLCFDEKNNLLDFSKTLSEYSKDFADIINIDSMENLKKQIQSGAVDYNKVKEDNVVIIQDPEELYDVNFIIPVRNRIEFSETMYKSFKAAADKSPLNITYTVVEHSENPQHSKFCKKNKINYMWVKSAPGDLFNKCLCYNMGAFFSSKSKYILFHDIDCLVQSDFFLKLFDNISNKQCKAIQCFTGRRVLYIHPELTQKVIAGETNVDELDIDNPQVSPPQIIGAPGGSIMLDRELFFDVGGYDAELFLANSPEDIFFWDKVDTIDKMHTSNEPHIEIFHMHHRPTYMDNPYINEMKATHLRFKNLDDTQKREIVSLKAEMIKEFK